MNNKKLITIALTTAFAVGITAPVFADTAVVVAAQDTAAVVTEAQQVMALATTVGVVQEINEDSKSPSILVKNDQTEIDFYINMDKASGNATWVIDENGLPIALKDLKGKEVVVSHSQAMTMSLPARCNATAVMVKGDVTPNYAVVEAVSKNADGSVTLTTDSGSRLVTVNKDASISPYLTKNLVFIDNLKVGDEVVLYYDIMALSYPGQAGTDRVLLLHPADAAVDSEKETDTAVDAIPLSDAMVNLRDAVSELGLSIQWNQEGSTVILNKDNSAFSATITIGSSDYGINKMRVKAENAAEIRDGRTYVPQSFITELKAALNENA